VALPSNLAHYDRLVDVIVAALAHEFDAPQKKTPPAGAERGRMPSHHKESTHVDYSAKGLRTSTS
jgi:hypothetical protein